MKAKCEFVLILLVNLKFSNSLSIFCQYEQSEKEVIGSVYECKVMEILEGNFDENEQDWLAYGNHTNEYSFLDVNFMDLTNIGEQIKSIPRRLNEIFPNLTGISCDDSEISSLNENDLNNYEGLQYLKISNSYIRKVPSLFFISTPKIMYLNFNKNQIESFGINLFESLEELWLEHNTCINGYGIGASEIATLVTLLEVLCPDETALDETTIEYTTTQFSVTTHLVTTTEDLEPSETEETSRTQTTIALISETTTTQKIPNCSSKEKLNLLILVLCFNLKNLKNIL